MGVLGELIYTRYSQPLWQGPVIHKLARKMMIVEGLPFPVNLLCYCEVILLRNTQLRTVMSFMRLNLSSVCCHLPSTLLLYALKSSFPALGVSIAWQILPRPSVPLAVVRKLPCRTITALYFSHVRSVTPSRRARERGPAVCECQCAPLGIVSVASVQRGSSGSWQHRAHHPVRTASI